MDMDVLAIEYDNQFFVNPDTATAYTTGMSFHFHRHHCSVVFLQRPPIPSSFLMNIQGSVMLTYVYQRIEEEVRAEKIEWRQAVGSCAYTKEHTSLSDYLKPNQLWEPSGAAE